ncbi:hypothetical protein Tco_0681948 [Tanacetum coccineum]|uniref:Uncharacterized protein n=1 Tax=Tanacetum coccineum TaxID=301880 RepID=A0ABQ4XPS0_9ASTR
MVGTGEIPGVLDESIFVDAEDDNEETESDSDDIYKYRINVRKNADSEMKDAEKTADITKETTEQPLTSSSFSMPSDYGNQFLNLSHNEEIFEQPPVLQQTTPILTTITTPPINTEASAITIAILEITPFIALQLRVVKLEQDMSEVKKIDHSATVLASIQSHVPPVVDKYVGTKLDDTLLKALERHTAYLVEKYYVLPTLESSKKQESKKSPEEIIRIKREQKEKKQDPTYTIKSTDKAALEKFNLKSALFKFMHKNKSANRNPANYRLYHALMEALIEDENAMDKEVANTGKSTKRIRTRESESTKKPSTTKESSKDKDPKVGSKTGKSAPAKDPVEEPTDEVIIDEQPTEDILISDEGHVSDPEDTDNTHMPKVPDTTTWQNAFAKAHQDPDENKLHNKIDDIGSFIRWYCRRIGKEELSKADLEDWYQRHGYREQGQNLNYNHISFLAIKVLRVTTFQNKTCLLPNHSTSNLEDAFSSMNILNYTSVSSDYFPASSGSSSFNSSENSTDNMIPPVFSSFYNNPCLKDVQAFYAKGITYFITRSYYSTRYFDFFAISVLPPSLLFDPRYFFVPEELLPPKKRICSSSSSSTTLSNSSRNQTCNLVSPSFSVSTSTPPQVFEIGKCSDKMYLKHHEKQVEDILNYLDELHLHRIERMEEERTNGNELKTNSRQIRTQAQQIGMTRYPSAIGNLWSLLHGEDGLDKWRRSWIAVMLFGVFVSASDVQ